MVQWIDNPITKEVETLDPRYYNRVYQLLVRRGLEVLAHPSKKTFMYIYYDSRKHTLICAKEPLCDQMFPEYETFYLRDLMFIGVDGDVLHFYFRDKELMVGVDTSRSAEIVKAFFVWLADEGRVVGI